MAVVMVVADGTDRQSLGRTDGPTRDGRSSRDLQPVRGYFIVPVSACLPSAITVWMTSWWPRVFGWRILQHRRSDWQGKQPASTVRPRGDGGVLCHSYRTFVVYIVYGLSWSHQTPVGASLYDRYWDGRMHRVRAQVDDQIDVVWTTTATRARAGSAWVSRLDGIVSPATRGEHCRVE